MRYRHSELVRFAKTLLAQAGMAPGIAQDVAEVLTEGDLLGKTTHGLHLLNGYLKEIEIGKMKLRGLPKVLNDAGASQLWDGRYLPGPFLARRAIAVATRKADKCGVGTVSIRHSHHLASMVAYLEPVAKSGRLLVMMSSDPASATVAAHGGLKPVYSPSVIAAGIPASGGPVLVDFSIGSVTNGMAMRVWKQGGKFGENYLQTFSGKPTNDPAALFAKKPGAILPLGGLAQGHKGFALAAIIEALTSGLGGHGRADKPGGWGASVFILVISPKFFGGVAAMKRECGWFAKTSRQSGARKRGEPVRMPGERALALRREGLKRGIALHPSVLAALQTLAKKSGVAFPKTV